MQSSFKGSDFVNLCCFCNAKVKEPVDGGKGMGQGNGSDGLSLLDGGVLQQGILGRFGAKPDVDGSLFQCLADLAGHTRGKLEIAAGVFFLEQATKFGDGGNDEQRDGFQANGPDTVLEHSEGVDATVCQCHELLDLGKQGQSWMPLPALLKREMPSSFSKETMAWLNPDCEICRRPAALL